MNMAKRDTSQPSSPSVAPERATCPLSRLHLDLDNPRFGGQHQRKLTEPDLLNAIADEHDLTDVLSSISANGYF